MYSWHISIKIVWKIKTKLAGVSGHGASLPPTQSSAEVQAGQGADSGLTLEWSRLARSLAGPVALLVGPAQARA